MKHTQGGKQCGDVEEQESGWCCEPRPALTAPNRYCNEQQDQRSERQPAGGRNFHEGLEKRLSRRVELAPILAQGGRMVRHERIAKQIDRAKHQADQGHGGIQEGGDTVTAPETWLLRNHRYYPYDPSLTWVCIPSFWRTCNKLSGRLDFDAYLTRRSGMA